MNRRSAIFCLAAVAKTALVSTFAMASEQATKTVARIAGPQWNVNGDWTPSVDAIQRHLLTAHGIDPAGLSLEEMLVMHDNHHNRMGYRHGHGKQETSKKSAKGYSKW